MKFESALGLLRQGKSIKRSSWDTPVVYGFVNLHLPNETSDMSVPYLYFAKVNKYNRQIEYISPYSLNMVDLWATDWEEYDEQLGK